MSASDAIYDAVAAIVAADTGAGGLSNNGSAQYVQKVERMHDREEVNATQIVEVEVAETDEKAFGGARIVDCAVRLHVFTTRDRGHGDLDAVMNRLRVLTAGATPTVGSYAVTPIEHLRMFEVSPSERSLHGILEQRWILRG